MRAYRLLVTGFAAAVVFVALAFSAQAQTRSATKPQPGPVARPEKCLRALDGSCTRPDVVEATRLRAVIIPSVRVAYEGTPMGTIGGPYIPFERFFQDNPIVFGLPTSTCVICNVVRRTK